MCKGENVSTPENYRDRCHGNKIGNLVVTKYIGLSWRMLTKVWVQTLEKMAKINDEKLLSDDSPLYNLKLVIW